MKRMIAVLFLFTAILITGCTIETNTTKNTESTTTTAVQTTTTTISTTTTTVPTTTTTEVYHQNASISYSSWGNAEFEQKMIDKFEEKYPWIDVYLDTSITGTGAAFTQNLVAAATAGTIPDVFAIDNVPTAIDNALTYDIASIWDNDPDTTKIYENIAATGRYGNVRYAAPSYQFIKGVYLNKTALIDEGFDLPEYDWTYQDMIDLARDFSDPNNYMYGIQGEAFDSIIPSLNDINVGYHTWDGIKFNFNSQAWIDAYNLMIQLREEGVEENMTGEEKELFFGAADAWPFFEGHTLMSIDGSWNLSYLIDNMMTKGYDIGFWPYPGGTAGQRIPVILDFMCVSAQTSFPEEAYLLMKWMSFGEDGWKARLQIMEEMNMPVTTFPVGDYPEVWTTLRNMASNIDGMQENIDLIHNGVPDTDKWLLGYNEFWGWLDADDNPYKETMPTMTPEEFAPIWELKMNQLIDDAYARHGLQK